MASELGPPSRREVGEEQAPGTGPLGDRDRLLGRGVAAPKLVLRRRRERRLLDQQVRAQRDLDEPVGGPAVAAVDDMGPIRIPDAERPGRHVVLGRPRRDRQAAEDERPVIRVLADIERVVEERRALAHDAGQAR